VVAHIKLVAENRSVNVAVDVAQEDQLEEHHRRDGFEQAQVRPEFMCSEPSSQPSLCCRCKRSAETVSSWICDLLDIGAMLATSSLT
jgi:hypothetical protein